MKIGEATSWLQSGLQGVYEDAEAALITALVMEHLTGLDRGARSVKREQPLDVHQLHHLTEIHQRLLGHEPVQYILGQAYFAGLALYVNASVLVPRPETEELADWVRQDVKRAGLPVFEKGATQPDGTTVLKILDVGTGSGCIALALKAWMPGAEVWGCDVSEEALNVARRNASELDIRVDFQGVNFLDSAQHRLLPTVHIIVSNPPYIPKQEGETLPANVFRHEPHTALFVPDEDPLLFYSALASFGKIRLYEGGSIYVEVHEERGSAVVELFTRAGYRDVALRKDMQGKDRMVKAVC